MTVNVIFSSTLGGSASTDPVDEGNTHHGVITSARELFVRHNGENSLSNCGFYIAPVEEADYVGDFSPEDDYRKVLEWGDAASTESFGGFMLNMDNDGSFPTWPTYPVASYGSEILASTDFTDAVNWAIGKGSVVESLNTGPNSNTVYSFSEDGTSGQHVALAAPVLSRSVQEISIYVKESGRRWVQLNLAQIIPAYSLGQWFDVRSGQLGTAVGNDLGDMRDVGIEGVGNGWWRCWMRVRPAAGTYLFSVFIGNADNSNSYQGASQESLLLSSVTVKQYTTIGAVSSTNYSVCKTGIGDSSANRIVFPKAMGLSSAGLVPPGLENDISFQVRFQIPSDEYNLGIRHVDLKVAFDYET